MRFALVALIALPLYAQSVSVGAKVGVGFNDPLGKWAESKYYLVGPTVEVSLPAGFAIEGSALYRRLGNSAGYLYGPAENPSFVQHRQRGNAWEFPLIGKYYFRERSTGWQPFFGTGWTLRTVEWNYDGFTETIAPSGDRVAVPFSGSDRSELNVGATVAAGVRLRVLGRMSLVPEVRYTRWGGRDGTFCRNEGGFFLGFRF